VRILYSFGQWCSGSQIQFERFAKQSSDDIRVAGYIGSSKNLLHINWTLDACNKDIKWHPIRAKKFFKHNGSPKIDLAVAGQLRSDIEKFDPELIICDFEPIVAHIAYTLGIKTWYCSPVHLFDGIDWQQGDLKYSYQLNPFRKILNNLPPADKIFVASPFGDIESSPVLKSGYSWLKPYHTPGKGLLRNKNILVVDKGRSSKIPRIFNSLDEPFVLFETDQIDNPVINYAQNLANGKYYHCNGESGYLADAIYNHTPKISLSPSLKDPEGLLNGIISQYYYFIHNLSQLELMDYYAVEEVEKVMKGAPCFSYLKKEWHHTLDEEIKNAFSS